MTTRAILPRSSRENSFAHARHKTEVQNASTASSVFVSNYGKTRSSQSLTLSGCWFACVQTFCSLKALFTEKPISNSCRVISAQSIGVGGWGALHTAFCNTLSNWLWTRSDINNRTDGFLQNGSGPFSTWGDGPGGGGVYLQQKSFSCCVQELQCWDWWDCAAVRAAVNPSKSHGNTELSQTMT